MKHAFTPVQLSTIEDDGLLSVIEGKRHVPFDIKRVYFIYHAVAGLDRGHHAHKKAHQAIFCIRGRFTLVLDDGHNRRSYRISNPDRGMEIPPRVWHEMKDMSRDTILLVVASDYYKESDYIRNYRQFLCYIKRK